jgi:hypothetical protein
MIVHMSDIHEVEMTCPECKHTFRDCPVTDGTDDATAGSAQCPECGEFFNINLDGSEWNPKPEEPNESMDGDHDSAMRDAGMGTDEDYGPSASEIY